MSHSELPRKATSRTAQGVLSCSTALTSAFGVFCVLAALLSAERAEAKCSAVAGGTRSNQILKVDPNSTVNCDATGTATDKVSIVGKDTDTAAEGLQLTIKKGATQLATTIVPPPHASPVDAVIAGPGSRIVVKSGGTIRASVPLQQGIYAQGKDIEIRVESGAQIVAQSEAIQGNRFRREAVNAQLNNFGTIRTQGNSGDAIIRLGDGSRLNNEKGGRIIRDVTSPSGSTSIIYGVSLNKGSYFTNRGEVSLDIGINGTNRPGDVVALNGSSTYDNFGTTTIAGDGGGTLVNSQGDGNRVVNRASGVLDAEFGGSAIRFGGNSNDVENYGKIVGSRTTGVAIRSLGDLFTYRQIGRGSVRGDVQAIAKIQRGSPLAFPDTAFLIFQGDSSTNFVQDVNTTEFFGFSDIVLEGPGALTLNQDFIRGEPQSSGDPTGHFKRSLSFDVDDPKGTLTVAGAIQDQPTKGGEAAVFKNGPGTLKLTGNSTTTGDLTIHGGTVDVDGGSFGGTAEIRTGAALLGRGEVTGGVVVQPNGRIAGDGAPGSVLKTDELAVRGGGIVEFELADNGGVLTTDTIDVKDRAFFGKGAIVDVIFNPKATLPALTGINIVTAGSFVDGFAPTPRFDAATLPKGQNFHLDLEATNLGGKFAHPGEKIPVGPGPGFVVLQIENFGANLTKPNAQQTVINAPYLVPTLAPTLTPPQAPVLVPPKVPGQVPTLLPTLTKGPGAKVTVPVIKGKPNTGITVVGGGVQVGGTLIPKPQNPNKIPVGTGTHVVTVKPPKIPGTTNFVSVTGGYGKVNQTHASPNTIYRLLYGPHKVTSYLTPKSYGNLAPLGQAQTKTQQQIGTVLTSTLPKPHARPDNVDQGNLVAALYPLTLEQINPALDSIAGADEDPTFVTVLNTREFQDAMQNRLMARRAGNPATSEAVAQGSPDTATDRVGWGQFLGGYADGDYLNESKIRSWGLVLGADQTVADDTVVGAALAYTDARIETGSGSDDKVRSFEVAGYAAWERGDWFVTGNAGFSYNWLDINRRATIGTYGETLSGKTNAKSFFAGVEAGKVVKTSWGALEPTLGLRYQYVNRDGYTEGGSTALARTISKETLNTGQGILGLRGYGDFKASGNMLWSYEVRAAYARELGDTDIDGTASLVSAPGTTFDVFTAGPGKDVGIFGFRLNGQGKMANYYLDYQLEARDRLKGQRVQLGLSMTF